MDYREGDAGCYHEARRGEQQQAMIMATTDQPDPQGQQRGPQQRRRRDDAHVEWRESECRQIDRQ